MRRIIYLLLLGLVLTAVSITALDADNYFECLSGDETACSDSEYATAKTIMVGFVILLGYVFLKSQRFI